MDIQEQFKQFLKNKSVALIGPASTLHMSNMGPEIDTYDITCRLNHHFADSSKMVVDYGSKNDICFSGPNIIYCHYEILEKIQPKFICFPRANCSDINYYKGLVSKIKCDHPEIKCFHVGNKFSRNIEKEMETPPNTGILAVCFLLTMPIKRLFISGFDFYQNNQKYYKKNGFGKVINNKFNEQMEKYGLIKWELEHDQEKHIEYFNKLYEKNKNMIKIGFDLENFIK